VRLRREAAFESWRILGSGVEVLMSDPPNSDQPPELHDKHAQRWRRVEDAILRQAGLLDVSVRASLATGRQIPEPLAVYAEKVARYAYRVTDDDVRKLQAAGYSEDQIFEATLSLALGAAQRRLQAGLGPLRATRQPSEMSVTGATGSTDSTSAEEKSEEKE
jgi:hypothetical protein